MSDIEEVRNRFEYWLDRIADRRGLTQGEVLYSDSYDEVWDKVKEEIDE